MKYLKKSVNQFIEGKNTLKKGQPIYPFINFKKNTRYVKLNTYCSNNINIYNEETDFEDIQDFIREHFDTILPDSYEISKIWLADRDLTANDIVIDFYGYKSIYIIIGITDINNAEKIKYLNKKKNNVNYLKESPFGTIITIQNNIRYYIYKYEIINENNPGFIHMKPPYNCFVKKIYIINPTDSESLVQLKNNIMYDKKIIEETNPDEFNDLINYFKLRKFISTNDITRQQRKRFNYVEYIDTTNFDDTDYIPYQIYQFNKILHPNIIFLCNGWPGINICTGNIEADYYLTIDQEDTKMSLGNGQLPKKSKIAISYNSFFGDNNKKIYPIFDKQYLNNNHNQFDFTDASQIFAKYYLNKYDYPIKLNHSSGLFDITSFNYMGVMNTIYPIGTEYKFITNESRYLHGSANNITQYSLVGPHKYNNISAIIKSNSINQKPIHKFGFICSAFSNLTIYGISNIFQGAFLGSKLLCQIIFKNSNIQNVKRLAFSKCYSLRKIYLPSSTNIKFYSGVFSDCKNLSQIILNYSPNFSFNYNDAFDGKDASDFDFNQNWQNTLEYITDILDNNNIQYNNNQVYRINRMIHCFFNTRNYQTANSPKTYDKINIYIINKNDDLYYQRFIEDVNLYNFVMNYIYNDGSLGNSGYDNKLFYTRQLNII